MTDLTRDRDLSADERGAAAYVLGDPRLPEGAALLAQLDAARVTGGLPRFLDLRVPSTVARTHASDGPLPGRAIVRDAAGDLVGEILVWMKDGYLSALEFAWVTDEPPTTWPSPEHIELTH